MGAQHLRERKGHKEMGGSVYDTAERSNRNASGSLANSRRRTQPALRALSAPFVNKRADVELFADRNETEEAIKNANETEMWAGDAFTTAVVKSGGALAYITPLL